MSDKRDKVFKNGPSQICGRQPLKNLKGIWSALADTILSKFIKAPFHKFLLGPFLNTLSQMILLKFEQTTMTFSLRKTNVEKTFVFSVIFTFIESQSNPSIS